MRASWLLTLTVVLALAVSARETAALDLDNVVMWCSGERDGGLLQCYEFSIEVCGTGITGVRVEDENANSYTLTSDPGDDCWEYCDEYPDLASLYAAHPPYIQYDFYFNEGQSDIDHDALEYGVLPPSTFPSIINVPHFSTDVWINPTYSWTSVAGASNAEGLFMDVEKVVGPDDEVDVYWQWDSDLTRTTWQPGTLNPLTQYIFDVSTVNTQGEGTGPQTTDGEDNYDYYAGFEESDSSTFWTGLGGIQLSLTATAEELGGQTYDRFGLTLECDNDIRIVEIAYNLESAKGPLFFDVAPHNAGGYDFTILPTSSAVGCYEYFSTDNSPHLAARFNDFEPGETLWFGIDVDGTDCTTFTAAQFDNAYLGVVIDLSPTYPGADPVLVELYFDGLSASTPIPEPTTGALLLVGGLTLLGCLRRRRKAKA